MKIRRNYASFNSRTRYRSQQRDRSLRLRRAV